MPAVCGAASRTCMGCRRSWAVARLRHTPAAASGTTHTHARYDSAGCTCQCAPPPPKNTTIGLVDEVDALWDEVVAQLEVDGLLPSGA
jgi:hypothetical protein